MCAIITETHTQKSSHSDWLMTLFAFLITVSLIHSHVEEKLCSWKGCISSHIFSGAQCFPPPPMKFILRLLDMPKLSLNLITPLTSVFQPQFLLRRAILAQKKQRQESGRTENQACAPKRWPEEAINIALLHQKKGTYLTNRQRWVWVSCYIYCYNPSTNLILHIYIYTYIF